MSDGNLPRGRKIEWPKKRRGRPKLRGSKLSREGRVVQTCRRAVP